MAGTLSTMILRELLDLCQDTHSSDWADIGGRPATTMVAGVFDPGMKDAATRTLEGHSMVVYEPNPCLALTWPVPEDPEAERPDRLERHQPEWAEQDSKDWKSARGGYAVVIYCGAPIWQTYLYYLDWGSGVGGYVPSFNPVFAEDRVDGVPQIERWETTR